MPLFRTSVVLISHLRPRPSRLLGPRRRLIDTRPDPLETGLHKTNDSINRKALCTQGLGIRLASERIGVESARAEEDGTAFFLPKEVKTSNNSKKKLFSDSSFFHAFCSRRTVWLGGLAGRWVTRLEGGGVADWCWSGRGNSGVGG